MTENQLKLLKIRLRSYPMLLTEIAIDEAKIEELYNALGGYHSPNLNGGGHSTNEVEKEMNKHQIREKIAKHEKRVNVNKLEIDNLEYYISQTEDDMQNILRLHYAKGISYEVLGNVRGYEASTLRKRVERELLELEYDK